MKKIVAAALAGVMVLSTAACGAKDFDAKGYVQGALDAQFKGEYAAHAEDIGQTEEEVKEQIEGETLKEAQQAVSMYGIPATDEEVQAYVDLIVNGIKKVEYEVQDAVKDDNDNYTVDVVITPVGLLDKLEEIFTAKIQEAAAGENFDESQYMGIFNEAVKESIDQAETYDPETVTLNVTYTEEGNNRIYSVNEDDINDLILVATHQKL